MLFVARIRDLYVYRNGIEIIEWMERVNMEMLDACNRTQWPSESKGSENQARSRRSLCGGPSHHLRGVRWSSHEKNFEIGGAETLFLGIWATYLDCISFWLNNLRLKVCRPSRRRGVPAPCFYGSGENTEIITGPRSETSLILSHS